MKKRWTTLILAVPLGGIAAFVGWYLWDTRYDVPVRFKAIQNTSTDSTPVEVTIHEYIPGTYTTTGKSITFSFPKSFYTWEEGAAGGPQHHIALSVEPKTFQSVDVIRSNIDRSGLPLDQRKSETLTLWGRNLGIRVYSPTKADSGVQGTWLSGKYEDDPSLAIGTQCGWTLFVTKRVKPVPPSALPKEVTIETLIDDNQFDLVGLIDDASVPRNKITAFSCSEHMSSCSVQTPYKGWMMGFRVHREAICNWREIASEISSFLDQHVVEETSAR